MRGAATSSTNLITTARNWFEDDGETDETNRTRFAYIDYLYSFDIRKIFDRIKTITSGISAGIGIACATLNKTDLVTGGWVGLTVGAMGAFATLCVYDCRAYHTLKNQKERSRGDELSSVA